MRLVMGVTIGQDMAVGAALSFQVDAFIRQRR